MAYSFNKKLALLLILIFFLIMVYLGSFFFSTEANLRNSSYTWLDSRFVPLADRIEIYGLKGSIILLRKNNTWVISHGNNDYPVKPLRVEELFRDLSRRKNYPLRSTTSAPETFGLAKGVSRIIVRGGVGLPLLDLLIGFTDVSGRELFLRKAGQKEIRSGEDIFTIYTESDDRFWYDLRIFPGLSPSMVQRIHCFPLSTGESPFTLSRKNNGWIIENTVFPVLRVESWLRSIIEAQGENFVDSMDWETVGTMVLELEDGSARILRISPPDAQGSRIAAVSGSPFAYSLSEWTIRRIWDSSFYTIELP